MKKIIILIFILSIFVGAVYFLSSKITTFEECEKAGWLVRSIRIYDGSGLVEQECFLWTGKSFVKQRSPADQLSQPNSQQQWETKIDDQPPVTIKVTPVELGTNKVVQALKFDIVFDTHSGSLDQDLMQIVTLIDNEGNVYKPMVWEGAPPGGHHREGILVFGPISTLPQSVELKIKDVGGIPERSFKWDIK